MQLFFVTGGWSRPKPGYRTKGGRTCLLSLFIVAIFETIYTDWGNHTRWGVNKYGDEGVFTSETEEVTEDW